MTKFTEYTKENAPEASREGLVNVEAKYGFIPNVLKYVAESPAALNTYLFATGQLAESSLSPAEQQIIYLNVSYANDCYYCVPAHSTVAKMSGAPDHIINAIRDGKEVDDLKLAALSKFTQAVIEKRGRVSEAELKAFEDAGYSKANILDVITGVAFKTITNYFNHIHDTTIDEQFKAQSWQGR